MHMRGTPETMSSLTDYDDVTAEVLEWMARRIDELRQMGVADVIADPGFGFAKTLEQNYEMLARLNAFHALGIFGKRTADTDLNWPQKWYIRLGYAIAGALVWPKSSLHGRSLR